MTGPDHASVQRRRSGPPLIATPRENPAVAMYTDK
jgi:hypothetical protein